MKSRRRFLQHIGAGLIPFAFGFSPKSLQFTMDNLQNERTLRVALMGLGSYANRVADAMKDSKRAKLTGVISGTPSKITDWQKRFDIPKENCYNYENFDAIKDSTFQSEIHWTCTPFRGPGGGPENAGRP